MQNLGYDFQKLKGHKTYVMGILNLTPDSFSDGGLFSSVEKALEHAEIMADDGADIIDIGGESSRPGSDPISAEEESKRILPVIEELVKRLKIPISVDTYKASIAKQALELGVSMINDISSLSADPDMASVIADYGSPVVLMHKKGSPKDMQINPSYNSLISEIISFFRSRIEYALNSGISSDKIIIDPGIGFGKTLEHNLEIIRRLGEFKCFGKPIMIGPSRKSFIGKILDLPVDDRVEGTAAVVAIAIMNGADIVRVHDVKEMVRVARMADAIVRMKPSLALG